MKETNQLRIKPAAGKISRREFIRVGSVAAASLIVPSQAVALAATREERRVLAFYNKHTHESLRVCYFSEGRYQTSALDDINHILRDHRNGNVIEIDRDLLDLLWKLTVKLDTGEPFHLFSGYRSPETNRMLRARSSRVARASYHTLGKAVDVSLPDCGISRLRAAAIELKQGGVGYYPRTRFVHLDVGPVRSW